MSSRSSLILGPIPPSASVHLKTLSSVLSAFLSFFRGPLGGRSPFCDNLLLREREDGNHRTDPMHQGRTLSSPLLGREDGAHLFPLSLFAEMKIIAVGRSVALSVPFLFFLYYPSSNFWLAFPLSLSVSVVVGLKRETE